MTPWIMPTIIRWESHGSGNFDTTVMTIEQRWLLNYFKRLFFPLMDFLQILQWQQPSKLFYTWLTIRSFKTFCCFFTTEKGIKFLSFCSTAQENLKSYKIRRKGYICTLITCLDLLHINQTVKPHQHTRNYTHTLSLTIFNHLICFMFYVTEIYGIWF